MDILVGIDKLSHEWPGKQTLKQATIGIYAGDRIGIVGRNGDGKSTLLRLISQEIQADSGTITLRHGIHIGMLGQHDALDNNLSVGQAIVGDVPEYEWAADASIRQIISALVGDLDWNQKVETLSGGERRRCDLARLLIAKWDVLLLDEPTNHLDIEAITWLAKHIKTRWRDGEGALLVVTHDRWFLDEVCSSMWEVHDAMIDPFEGGYSAYIQQRAEREAQAEIQEVKRQNTLRKELSWLAHGAKARTSKPKFRIDAAQALIANDPPLRNPLELKRLAVTRLGKQVIDVHDMSFGYGDAEVIRKLNWLIGPGERIGILGSNGAGKTTLLRLLSGQIKPSSGGVVIGKSVKFGWLSQHMNVLNTHIGRSVTQALAQYKTRVLVDGKETSSEKLLERLGFSRDDFLTRVENLSGGQRRRLSLLLVLLEEPNVLILDEPGNDLDTDMLAEVESLLDSWPGTLILVSHDRYLLERVTDDQFALIDATIRHVPGGVDEYLELVNKHISNGVNEIQPNKAHSNDLEKPQMSGAIRQTKKRRLESISRQLEKLKNEPTRLTKELKCVDQSDYKALLQKQEEIDAINEKISLLEEEWLELADELGE